MLDKILEADNRIREIAHRTPVMTSRQLDEKSGANIYLKCENYQRGGAFKFRGAYNTISQLSDDQKKIGIITHSSGNHAQAVALSGQLLNIKTVIIMPNNAPQVKINATKGYGATVIFCEPTQQARVAAVEREIEKHGYTLVHPYDNDNIIAGAATASKELIEEIPDLDIVIAPVGGGGLISGTALYTKLAETGIDVVGAEPKGADDAYRSFISGTRVTEQEPTTIADGLRTTLSERTFNYITEYVDDIIRVHDIQTIETLKFIMERMKLVIEPSSAVPIAAALNNDQFNGKKIGVIISGGNLDLEPLFDKLKPIDE